MNTTLFLAHIYGPILLAIGVGIFSSRNYYRRIYKELEKDVLAVLTFGMVAMAAGLAQLYFHNEWNTLPEIVVSILGWGFLLKGIMFVVFPKLVDKAGDEWARRKIIPFAGYATMIVGIYLTWFAYFS